MRAVFACAAVFALAACNSEEPAAPEPVQAQVVMPVKPTMPAPDEELFAAAYAEACGKTQPVSGSMCKSRGFGQEGFVCDYGLGDDEYLRNKTTIVPVEGKWALAEPEKTCAADAA
jgi:hypothetical protein